MMQLHILGGGAAKGIVGALQASFEQDHGVTFHTKFSAVGAIRDGFKAGEPCDLLILTHALVRDLTLEGYLRADAQADVGPVQTGVAVPDGAPLPAMATPEALAATLRQASGFYVPDLQRSTAGLHIAGMLKVLGLDQELAGKIHEFPNGETAMRTMAARGGAGAVGCTQMTEIRMTPGLTWVGALPDPHALSTIYTAAVSTRAAQPDLARQLLSALTGPNALVQRKTCGFDI